MREPVGVAATVGPEPVGPEPVGVPPPVVGPVPVGVALGAVVGDG